MGRGSFASLQKPGFIRRWSRAGTDEESGVMQTVDKPAIPSALQPSEAYSTPLPTLSMVVLSIVRLIFCPRVG